jgi:hypothetical protein
MDTEDKVVFAVMAATVAVILLVCGVGIWAAIELVQWVTSK